MIRTVSTHSCAADALLFLRIRQLDNGSMASSSAQVKPLVNAFSELGTFKALAEYTDKTVSRTKMYDGFVDAVREDSVQEQNLSLLALASIGKSLHQFDDQAEGYGFRKGTDKGRCQDAIQDALTTLLPPMLRLHIGEAIKQYNEFIQQNPSDPLRAKPVPVAPLHPCKEKTNSFKTSLVETSFQKKASSTNSRMNALFVYTYLQHQGQVPDALQQYGRFNGTTFLKADDARNRLPQLPIWLDSNTAAAEGATYSEILRKMAWADKVDQKGPRVGQKGLSELKDNTAFLKSILERAPLTGLYMPPHEYELSTATSKSCKR
ncbi:hypothetical protein B0H63DRAFT_565144 [Podospora didyma]|uniref:Uncharacterized protein n=1 Tax=Podospora didyma TaxID=330526 RepID=A0AAE0N368_9PEZI|nr:hypothetical protein B0H63DRAFT_565144 [Podospora didyma]